MNYLMEIFFRRRVAAPVADRLTETQATVHKCQAWFHGGMSRDKANKILQAHANTDGYVVTFHCQCDCFLSLFIKLKLEILFFLFDVVDTSFIFFRVFLVRDSSVAGGFVISVTAGSKNIHSQVLPVSSNTFPPSESSLLCSAINP